MQPISARRSAGVCTRLASADFPRRAPDAVVDRRRQVRRESASMPVLGVRYCIAAFQGRPAAMVGVFAPAPASSPAYRATQDRPRNSAADLDSVLGFPSATVEGYAALRQAAGRCGPATCRYRQCAPSASDGGCTLWERRPADRRARGSPRVHEPRQHVIARRSRLARLIGLDD